MIQRIYGPKRLRNTPIGDVCIIESKIRIDSTANEKSSYAVVHVEECPVIKHKMEPPCKDFKDKQGYGGRYCLAIVEDQEGSWQCKHYIDRRHGLVFCAAMVDAD